MKTTLTKPRLGFLGVGWIGLSRLEAVEASGLATIAAVADADHDRAREVAEGKGCAHSGTSLEHLLEAEVDGIVIATPSALHAEQSITALEAGVPVFCQKPLARTADEAAAVVNIARKQDLLLGADMSYRHVRAFEAASAEVRRNSDDIYALDVKFHNAYGPDKSWFTDPRLSGGGCVIDLGTHLVDLVVWWLGTSDLRVVDARLYHQGRLLESPVTVAEDYAEVILAAGDTTVRLTCSWFLPLGVDASISAAAYTPKIGIDVVNVDGSFYDFTARRHIDRNTDILAMPPDDWGGRALCAWARKIADGHGFDAAIEDQIAVAATIDRIYGRTA